MNLQSFDIHQFENNPESSATLAANRPRLIKSAIKVLDLLMKGDKLTVKCAILYHDISSLPRRIMDLEQFFQKEIPGFKIPEQVIEGGRKIWYLDERSKVLIESVLNKGE